MYSTDTCQGKELTERFDVMPRGEALSNIPLACAAERRRNHPIGFQNSTYTVGEAWALSMAHYWSGLEVVSPCCKPGDALKLAMA